MVRSLYNNTPTVLSTFTESGVDATQMQPGKRVIEIHSIADRQTFFYSTYRANILKYSTAGNEEVLVLTMPHRNNPGILAMVNFMTKSRQPK
jgi:hypothetical protein